MTSIGGSFCDPTTRLVDCHVYESLPVGVSRLRDDDRVPSARHAGRGELPVIARLRPDRLSVPAVGIEEPRPDATGDRIPTDPLVNGEHVAARAADLDILQEEILVARSTCTS